MDGDAKIRACAPAEYWEPAADRAARIMACAPKPRLATLARLKLCVTESRSHRDDDMAKATPAPTMPALEAALAALHRHRARPLPSARPTPPRLPPAPAASNGGKVPQKSETLPFGRASVPVLRGVAGPILVPLPGGSPAVAATSSVDRPVKTSDLMGRTLHPSKDPAPTQPLDHGVRVYWDFRDRISSDIRAERVSPTAAELVEHSARKYNLMKADAAEWTERFLRALQRDIKPRRTPPGVDPR